MATLVHLNGPPAVGKSTIAARLVRDWPLALCLDIDALRVQLGGWAEWPESKKVARQLGLDLAGSHLRNGYDVVLPQLLVLSDQTRRFEQVARDAGGEFVEVILRASPEELKPRVQAAHGASAHPRNEFSVAELLDQIAYANDAIAAMAAQFDPVVVVDVGALDEADAAAAVRAALGQWVYERT